MHDHQLKPSLNGCQLWSECEVIAKGMGDIYSEWARVYDFFFPDRSDEVAFWARLAEARSQRLLDLMCGTAEVSLGLARKGYLVTGFDLSPAMLAVAAERLTAAADYPARNVSLAQGDACAIAAADNSFDFAIVGGNGSFNHLDADEADAVLRELARVLRPDGSLGMELMNPGLLKEVYPTRAFGPLRPTPPGVLVEKVSHNRFDRTEGLFHIRQVTRTQVGGREGEFEVSFALHVRQPAEVRTMLKRAGFGNVRFFGDYALGAFDRWSADMLVVAHRTCTAPVP